MKVLYLINTTVMGGANISFINLIKGMYKRSIDCYVIYPDEVVDKDFDKQISPYVKGMYHANLKNYFHSINDNKMKKSIRNSKLYQDLKHYVEDQDLNNIVKKVNPDIIHTNVGVLQGGYRVSRKFNIPHVWHLREYQTKDFLWEIEPSKSKFIEMLKHGYVVAITQDILKYFNLQNYSKAEVIYNGCFSKSDISLTMPKDKFFLCCSRISPEKGYDDVINAYSEFYKKNPEYKLLIAGFGDPLYIEKLKKMAQEKGCLRGIKFLGFKNRKDIKQLMSSATALIVASRFEGFGRMTAEAAFYGCLVIGHNTGGTKEILQKTGGITYVGGASKLEHAMEKAISYNIGKYKSIVKRAQSVAVEKFSNEQYVNEVLKLYKSILYKK